MKKHKKIKGDLGVKATKTYINTRTELKVIKELENKEGTITTEWESIHGQHQDVTIFEDEQLPKSQHHERFKAEKHGINTKTLHKATQRNTHNTQKGSTKTIKHKNRKFTNKDNNREDNQRQR